METHKSTTQIFDRTDICLKLHFNFLHSTLVKLSFRK